MDSKSKTEEQMMKKNHIGKLFIPVLMMCAVLFALPASANIGKIVYGYGDNHAFDSDGNRRVLTRGSEIKEGDTLVTGRGRLHVRLIDGGFISVYPHSEYKIDKFKFSGKKASNTTGRTSKKVSPAKESKEDRGFFSLLKGAARQVTGLLGRTYNENFKFKTAVATIGIRGTGFFARLCQADCFDADGNPVQDGMYVKNNTGVITMRNDAGEVALAQGQSAFAASSEDSPQQVIQPPISYSLITPDTELYDFDEKVIDPAFVPEGDVAIPVVPTEPPVTQPFVTLTTLEYVASEGTNLSSPVNNIDSTNGIDVIQQNGNEIIKFDGTGTDAGSVSYGQGTAVLVESGADLTLGVMWNRWGSGYTLTEGGFDLTTAGAVSGKDIHIIGTNNITPNFAALVASGATVSYMNTGGTSPTIEGFAGSQVGTQTLNVSINYANSEVTVFDLGVNFGATSMNTSLITQTFISATRADTFNGVNQIDLAGSCSGPGCGANGGFVSGAATINLVGPNAEGIYGSYNLTNQENAVSGSYVAKDTGLLAGPGTQL